MEKSKATILCIDDNGPELDAYKELLENSGCYDVLTAQTPREGLASFGSNVIDVVILDYEMPGMNGNLVASRMKRMKSGVPILLLSAHDDLPKSKLRHVDGFLCKSEPWPNILSALHKLLEPRLISFDRWWETWQHQRLSLGGS